MGVFLTFVSLSLHILRQRSGRPNRALHKLPWAGAKGRAWERSTLIMCGKGLESKSGRYYTWPFSVWLQCPKDGFPWQCILSLKPHTCGNIAKPALPHTPVGRMSDCYRLGQCEEGIQSAPVLAQAATVISSWMEPRARSSTLLLTFNVDSLLFVSP